MKFSPSIVLMLLIGCRSASDDVDSQIIVLQELAQEQRNLYEEQSATILALEERLAASETEIEELKTQLSQWEEASLEAQLVEASQNNSDRLDVLEELDIATQTWVSEGYTSLDDFALHQTEAQDNLLAVQQSLNDLDVLISTNASGIAANTALITDNAGSISTNATSITTNAASIVNNGQSIQTLSTQLTALETSVATNADNIDALELSVQDNIDAIDTNALAIQTNLDSITLHATDISTNQTAISDNATLITDLTAVVGTNTTNIASNNSAITTNTSDISSNLGLINTNLTSIGTNTTNIASNLDAINVNVTSIIDNTDLITANGVLITDLTAVVGTNTTNIGTNLDSITTNASSITTNAGLITTNDTRIAVLEDDYIPDLDDLFSTLTVDGTNIEIAGSLDVSNYIHGSTLRFRNCGTTYSCTPMQCLALCQANGERMAFGSEVLAYASTGNQRCAHMWMLDDESPQKVMTAYPMYSNRTTGGCGTTNTGDVPRLESVARGIPWDTTVTYDCACSTQN